LEISPTQKAAEEILINTFQKIHKKKLTQQNHTSICATLIKLIIQTAHEQLHPDQVKPSFKLKQLNNTPLLNKLLCEQISLKQYCEESNLAREEVSQKLREEVALLRKIKTENYFFVEKQLPQPR
jgi:hypothetical protein